MATLLQRERRTAELVENLQASFTFQHATGRNSYTPRRRTLCAVSGNNHLLQVLLEPLRVFQLVRLFRLAGLELVAQQGEHRGVGAFFPAWRWRWWERVGEKAVKEEEGGGGGV